MKVGDRVKVRGVSRRDPAWDTGIVVAMKRGVPVVAWKRAGETYTEDPAALEVF